jgi:hypothetical protein
MISGCVCLLYLIVFCCNIHIGCTYFSEQFLHSVNESTSRYLTKFQRSFEFVYAPGQCLGVETLNENVLRNYQKIPYGVRHVCGSHPEYAKFVLVSRNNSLNISHACNSKKNWNPESFLSLIRNQSIGIYGDSLARQVFNGLTGALMKYHTTFFKNGGDYTNHFYSDFQVNISLCEDGFGQQAIHLHKHSEFKKCLQPMMDSVDYLILGFAAWYKPYFSLREKIEKNYYQNMFYSFLYYQRTLMKIREWIAHYPSSSTSSRRNPHPIKVIWRLSPHASNYDELVFLHGENLSSIYSHTNGLLWSRNFTQYSAIWPGLYNHVQRNISRSYNDLILDWYSLSYSYLERFRAVYYYDQGESSSKKDLLVHRDSLHYCVETIPTASNILLFELLRPENVLNG